jgi:ubiquinone/menaquinone biosynthesis C-methylase UbiE
VTELLLAYLRGGSVTALDVDPAMLDHARRHLGDDEPVRFVEATATATGVAEGSFDAVLVRFVLQHLPDPGAVLRELKRVLRQRGRLLVIDAISRSARSSTPSRPSRAT